MYSYELERRLEIADSQIAELLAALREIVKAEGAYSRDPLTHASNCIKDMQAIAQDVIDKVECQ